MATWCNVRLLGLGPKKAVAAFAAKARESPRDLFRGDMLAEEAAGLRGERVERVDADLYREVFTFQARNGDGQEHFERLSRRRRRLSFVLVCGDLNAGSYGSYLIHKGVSSLHGTSRSVEEAGLGKHRFNPDLESDANEGRFGTPP